MIEIKTFTTLVTVIDSGTVDRVREWIGAEPDSPQWRIVESYVENVRLQYTYVAAWRNGNLRCLKSREVAMLNSLERAFE